MRGDTDVNTHTGTLTTQLDTYLVSQRTGSHAGDDLCIMVQNKTKFTNCGLTVITLCQVTSAIFLLRRGCENMSKKRNDSEQLIGTPNFLELYLEKWY